MDPHIEFEYQGKVYSVSPIALRLKKIVLPDGRVLEVGGWFEFDDRPPQFYGLKEVPILKTVDTSPEEIAFQVRAVLARCISVSL